MFLRISNKIRLDLKSSAVVFQPCWPPSLLAIYVIEKGVLKINNNNQKIIIE